MNARRPARSRNARANPLGFDRHRRRRHRRGVALEAARRANNVLLLEQKDFAWGASSRSSKMVHGGLRYLAEGRFGLTRDALRERERMARELPDLVIRQPYAFVVRAGEFPGRWPMKAALWLYDFSPASAIIAGWVASGCSNAFRASRRAACAGR